MKTAASCLAFAALLTLASCDREAAAERVPQTAQEMYARAQELIRPNVEHAESDFKGALEWLQKAADAGYLQAQTDLAALYLEGGKGIEKNAGLAHEWFSKAAAQGSKEACDFRASWSTRAAAWQRTCRPPWPIGARRRMPG